MKQFHWLLCVAKNRNWARKIAPLSNLTRASLLEQGRLLSDWLICYPSTQTLFERALPKILKTKMASERAISC